MNNMKVFNGISFHKLKDILDKIKSINIVLIGDICLDVYWQSDMTKSELSRETPHFPLPVVKEWMAPGAGGNVAANIKALKPKSLKVLGVIGKDWRGDALLNALSGLEINTDGIVISNKLITNAYCKPIRKGISSVEYEDPRIDFNNYEKLSQEDELKLMENLDKNISEADVLCVSDQLLFGCITPAIREKIINFAKNGLKVIVDSRDRIGLYSGVILKPNEVEGLRTAYNRTVVTGAAFEDYIKAAQTLAQRNKSSVCMTLGAKGCLYTNSEETIHIPSYEVTPPLDICGAGDTFLSAFSCAIAAGAEAHEAASFGNLAADVTIKKIGITGTACPEEIIDRHDNIFITNSLL